MKNFSALFSALIFVFFTSVHSNAQNSFTYTNQGKWTFGLNAGGAFQTSDVDPAPGIGGGLYLGYSLYKKSYSFFNVDLRGRFLAAQTRGIDDDPSFTANEDPALNGTYDPDIDFSDTEGGKYFANHRTDATELSLELAVGLNKLRERTGVIFYGFGGGGLYNYKVNIDQKDADGNAYDYSSLSSPSTSDLNSLRDNNYESDAYNSQGFRYIGDLTAGYGLGYQFTEGFALILEHKMTFPLHSQLDAQAFDAPRTGIFKNDVQHFVGLSLEFMFGEDAEGNTYEEHDADTETGASGGINETGGGTTTIEKKNPPSVNIKIPFSDPYKTESASANVIATVENMASRNGIQFILNGTAYSNFNFQQRENKLSANINLKPGTNTITIKATNKDGSDQDHVKIIRKEQQQEDPENPPVVRFSDPSSTKTVTQNTYMIKAGTKNITSADQLQLVHNGKDVNNFYFNANTGLLTYNVNLKKGKNTFSLTGTNNDGTSSDQTLIIYEDQSKSDAPPVVTINNPSGNTQQVNNPSYTLVARITNIDTKQQATVLVNGQKTQNFNFNNIIGQIQLPLTLENGTNKITVSGYNDAGSDSKSVTIIYKPETKIYPPTVNFTTPSSSKTNVKTQAYNATAVVSNINQAGQLSLKVNGSSNSNFTFNSNTKQVNIPLTLQKGINIIYLKATNQAGSDFETIRLIYNPPLALPTVQITNPANSPKSVQNSSFTFIGKVTEINNKSQLVVRFNGNKTGNYQFNPVNGTVKYKAQLNPGVNLFRIKASNSAGQAVDAGKVIYTQKLNAPVVEITNPPSFPHNTNNNSFTVKASVSNVQNKSQITVKVKGNVTNSFSFNSSTGQLILPLTLLPGKTGVSISASTKGGSDQDATILIYKKKINLPDPVVNITQPSANPHTSSSCKETIIATVKHVSGKQNISVKKNNVTLPAGKWSYSNGTVSLSDAILGNSATYVITATNISGSAKDGITIKCNPKITICHIPPGNPNNPQTIQIPQSAWPAHKAHGDTKGACPNYSPPSLNLVKPSSSPHVANNCKANVKIKTNHVSTASQISVTKNGSAFQGWSFSNNSIAWNETVSGLATYQVTVTTPGGTTNQTIKIRCPGPKITICHYPPSNPNNPHTMDIYPHEWPVHKAHGDKRGTCPNQTGSSTPATINISTPGDKSILSQSPVQFKATVAHISNKNNLNLSVNGSNIAFNFNANTGEMTANINLQPGNNNITVTANNSAGNITKSIRVTYNSGSQKIKGGGKKPGKIKPKVKPGGN